MIQLHICEDSGHQLKQIKKALEYACAIISEEMHIVNRRPSVDGGQL